MYNTVVWLYNEIIARPWIWLGIGIVLISFVQAIFNGIAKIICAVKGKTVKLENWE